MFDRARLIEVAGGWVYWLAFLLLLEVGNVVMAVLGHQTISVSREVLRILGAGLLGGLTSPFLLAMVRRFPVEGSARLRHGLLQLFGAAVASVLLLLIGVVVGTVAGIPQRSSLAAEFSANGGLMFYCVLAFVIGGNVLTRRRSVPVEQEVHRQILAVRDGHKTRMIVADEIDWIETQGNYVALHCGERVCLVRETLSSFESRLDPAKFRRIHRGAVVRLARIKEIVPLLNGDRRLVLDTGAELRASRTYRVNLPDAAPPSSKPPSPAAGSPAPSA